MSAVEKVKVVGPVVPLFEAKNKVRVVVGEGGKTLYICTNCGSEYERNLVSYCRADCIP